ncbi:MAG: hypothetical protein HYR92_07235 [Burkholderiales bacterium]|nr:hypothetical protein [Burkholderiales bacterium]
MKTSNPQQRLIVGAFILVIGVLALADNLHFFNAHDIIRFWPTVFIIVGALKLSNTRTRSGTLIGGGMVLLGIAMTLNYLGLISFRMRDWWPLIIIMAGLAMIFKDKLRDTDASGLCSKENTNESTIDVVAVMSGHQGNVASQDFRGGSVTAIMGGAEIDLRNALIQTEAVIDITAFWGGVSLKIPKDWRVVNNGIAFLGGIDDSSEPAIDANKRLIITGTAVMGGVEIKN